MNKLISLLSILLLTGCVSNSVYNNKITECENLKDSIYKQHIEMIALQDTICYYRNSFVEIDTANITYSYQKDIDSLKAELFISNYKLGRIQSYCNIVKRNSSQSKFLLGWINRVLDE